MASNLVEKHWDELWRRSRDDEHFVGVTRLDERPLGLVWCAQRRHPYLDVPVGVLQWIFVAPWARGHGVASAMVESGKEWMRLRGLRSMEVSVLYDNESARRLYRRAGLTVGDVRMMGSLD
jgi:ribosomal protein S18 acetylase RimI-like enzyme